MNWLGLLFLLPLGFVYYLFFWKGRGYRLLHKPEQMYSSPELRFRYSPDDLSAYFSSIADQAALSRLWRWKYLATAAFLLAMVCIPFNFDMPNWLRIAMVIAAGLRALLALPETALLLRQQKQHMAQQPLTGAKLCSVLTSAKWCVTGLWLLGLFGFLMFRASKIGK